GYPSFKRMETALKLQQLPATVKRISGKMGKKPLRRMPYLQLDGMKGLYLFLRGYFMPAEIARHLEMDEKEVWQVLEDMPVMNKIHLNHSGDLAGWMEFNLYMQNQLLRDADVMGMAHSLEIRVPLLDKELVRLALSLQPDIKYTGTHPKQMLIDAF